ncbi:MAG: methionine--tRNA ligase, partial [Bacteroidota bacterium]
NCGTSLSPTELIEPVSTLSGEKPVMKETKHWYLPMNKYEDWLKEWIIAGHKEWKANVYGQCKSWISQGLLPRAMTRDLDWGVKVPLANADGKVLYVWFDAPIGYISATKEWAAANNKDWEPYWKSQDTKLVHFIGKDNIVFHCIIFPCILKAEGSYVLPNNVPANEFLNLEGNKISTSKNWAVWLHEYLEEFEGKEDVLRYTLCANAPETSDNDFTWKDFQARNNNELVSILGNFVNRVYVLTNKFFSGRLPEKGELFDVDTQVINSLSEFPDKIAKSLENFKFREALNNYMDLARLGNKYLADTEPWHLIKENSARVETIMNISAQIAANLAVLGEPLLPFSSQKLSKCFGLGKKIWADAGGIDLVEAGVELVNIGLLFQKIEDSTVEKQVKKLEDTKKANELEKAEVPAFKEEIVFDDFMKLDIRIGTIKAAEKVKKSKKLLKLIVDTGLDERTVLSGIGQHYNPESIIGQQVSILVNLAPRKMMGTESQGMILMAEDKDGSLKFVLPSEPVSSGSTVS